MHDLLLLLGKVIPKDLAVEKLKESMDVYSVNPSDENWSSLLSSCMILLSIDAVKDKDISEMSKEMAETQRIKERLSSSINS